MAKWKQGARTVRQLTQAIRAGRPLNIHRANFDSFDEITVPLTRHKSWLLAVLVSDDLLLNGYCLLRTLDVTELSVSMSAFYSRVLKKRKLRVRKLSKFPVGSLQESLSWLAKSSFSVISIHCEEARPDLVNVGTIDEITRTTVRLRLVSREAKLGELVTPIQLKEITRVDFGGGYEDALSICLA